MATYIWKREGGDVEIVTLGDFLEILTGIQLNQVDQEITHNILEGSFLSWLKENFPKKIILITSLEKSLQEYTPQQIREMLIRELRGISD
jgi:hypothetical protein